MCVCVCVYFLKFSKSKIIKMFLQCPSDIPYDKRIEELLHGPTVGFMTHYIMQPVKSSMCIVIVSEDVMARYGQQNQVLVFSFDQSHIFEKVLHQNMDFWFPLRRGGSSGFGPPSCKGTKLWMLVIRVMLSLLHPSRSLFPVLQMPSLSHLLILTAWSLLAFNL